MHDISTRVQFHCLAIIPFGVALLLVAILLYGCGQKSPEQQAPKQTITNENLQTAYAKQMRHSFMYAKFIKQAEKEKLFNVANLYRAISRSEAIHAENHATLMRSRGFEPKTPLYDSVAIGTIVQSFKMSLQSEEIETESMFPNLIRTAGLERDTIAMNQFQQTMEADNRQAELFKDASDHAGKIPKVPYLICPGCGYIITSESTDECPVCHTGKGKFEKVS
jgi:rubrerythrin